MLNLIKQNHYRHKICVCVELIGGRKKNDVDCGKV